MSYTITSDRWDYAKVNGDSITDEELLAMGANIDALVVGGHITTNASAKATAPVAQPATTEGATK